MDQSSSNYLVDSSSYNTVGTSTTWQCSYWIYDATQNHYVLYSPYVGLTLPVNILHRNGGVQVNDGILHADATALTPTPGAWSHMLITDNTGTISVKQDVVAVPVSGSINATAAIAGNVTLFRGGATVFDLRIKDGTADSTAWDYYRQDILTNNGNIVLPTA